MTDRRADLDDLEREIQDHLEAETLDNIARGMSEHDARTAALRKFGNIISVAPMFWHRGHRDHRDHREASRVSGLHTRAYLALLPLEGS
jgi:hypothetical protein